MIHRVFIGHDSRFPEPGLVLAHSLRKHSSVPLDIRFLDARHLADCYDFKLPHDKLATTEFAYSRFLVPYLCGYVGSALFMDCDILSLGDIAPLLLGDMEGLALRVVKHDYQPPPGLKMHGQPQTSYPRKLWSSVMLMDCSKLKLWTKQVVQTAGGAYLHRFKDIPDEQIGSLDTDWNEVYMLKSSTKLFHWTEGMVWNDPEWKRLLEFGRTYLEDFPRRDVWLDAYEEYLKDVSNG